MCRLSWNLGASNSWNPQGLSRTVMGLLYFYSEGNAHKTITECKLRENRNRESSVLHTNGRKKPCWQYWSQALSHLSGIYKNMQTTMLSIVTFMNTDSGKAAILLGGGRGNHVYMCTVKLHEGLKKRALLCSPCAMSLSLVTSVVVNSQSWIRLAAKLGINSMDR